MIFLKFYKKINIFNFSLEISTNITKIFTKISKFFYENFDINYKYYIHFFGGKIFYPPYRKNEIFTNFC